MPPNTAPLALKDDPAFARYFKMLKMHLPRGAVVLKMQTDGVDPSILDRDPDALSPNQPSLTRAEVPAPSSGRLALQAVFGAATAEAKSSRDDETAEPMPPNTAPLALKNDPAFARYFKMLKMHLPRGAVVLKMQTDGVDPSILDQDPEALSPNQPSLKWAEVPAPSSGRLALQAVFGAAAAEAKSSRDDETAEPMPPNTAPLALKDDPAFARYFKMLKMHLPRGAVVLKMQADGVDPSILDRDPDALSPNQRSLCTNGPASSLLQPPCLRSQPGEGGGHKPPSGSRGNPMADLMAGIAGGAAKLKKRRTALSGGGGTAHGIYGPERDKFIEKMSTRIDVAGRKIESLLDQINEAEVQCRTLREYFGESGSALESHRIFSTLKHFVDLLAQSKRAYERAHGHVVVVTSRRRSASYLTEYGDGDGYLESHMWAVNTCVATQFGSGAIEAVRVKEHVYMVRLKWGVGFLQRSAIIDVNCIVDTPYGRGRVVAVNDPISYQVELIWGYALLQPESVLWTGDVYSIVVESETNSNSDSDVSVASYDDGNWNSLGNSDESGSFGLSESDSDFEGEEGGEEEGKYDAF
jgi:hypothetical protein